VNAEERYRNEAHVLTLERDAAVAEAERLRALPDTGPGWRRVHAARVKNLEAEVERLREEREDSLSRWNQIAESEAEVERMRADGLTLVAEVDRLFEEGHAAEAEVERLRSLLQYVAENASGGDVPESWPEWVSDRLAALAEEEA